MDRCSTQQSQSALVMLIPQAEKLVATFRAAYDLAAAVVMPTHATILFPFVLPEQIDDMTVNRLRACLCARQPFDFNLFGIKRFSRHIYLAFEPEDSFQALTLAVWEAFPDCPPYEGKYSDIIPHLTVGSVTNEQVLERIAQDLMVVAERFLPIPVRATEVALMDNRQGPWAVVETFPLGGS